MDRFGRISRLRSGERNFRSRCDGYGHRQPVRRAQHAAAAGAVQHVRVDRRRHIRVTEQLPDRPDVVPVLEKMRREGVPERVARDSLRCAARQRRRSNRTLQTLLVHVMPSPNSAPRIDRQLPGRKQPLPGPLASRIRVLPLECVWQPDSRHTIRSVFLRQHPQPFEVRRQSPFESTRAASPPDPFLPFRLVPGSRDASGPRPLPSTGDTRSAGDRTRTASSPSATRTKRLVHAIEQPRRPKCLFHDAPHDPSVRRCGQGLSQAWNLRPTKAGRVTARCDASSWREVRPRPYY